MIRNYRKRINVTLILFLISLRIWPQLPYFVADKSGTADYSEHLEIVTDRDIYFTGEQVWCRVLATTSAQDDIFLSSIIYLELLDTLNTPLVRIKMPVQGQGGSTVFKVPDIIESGRYILRAYTRWMNNFDSELFAYRFLDIINPFAINTTLPFQDSRPVEEKKSSASLMPEHYEIVLSTDKNEYGPRSRISLSINTTSKRKLIEGLTLSVVKASLLSAEGEDVLTDPVPAAEVNAGDTLIFPEIEGELIAGIMLNSDTYQPLGNCIISLSSVGRDDGCIFTKTSGNGEFVFTGTSFTGLNEIVIKPLFENNVPTYVEIKSPFSAKYHSYSKINGSADTNRLEDLNKAAVSMQVRSIYEPFIKKINQSNESDKGISFYGQPAREVWLKDYIELSDLREVLKEIIKEVTVVKQDGKTFLRVLSANAYEQFGNPALVLLDGVPVSDIEALLKIPAREIERARIVNTRFFYKELIFEGIASFTSAEAGLEYPVINNSSYRRLFEGSREYTGFTAPDYSSKNTMDENLPDFRNTLFWDDELNLNEQGEADIEFYSGDETGEFTVLVTGFTSEGERVAGKTSFRVLKK